MRKKWINVSSSLKKKNFIVRRKGIIFKENEKKYIIQDGWNGRSTNNQQMDGLYKF